jgi:membrane protein implicated in regulation of membrane protease activity
MSWSFTIPLAIALTVAYILKKSADEIAYLAAAILIVSLVLSLVLAPWPVQLLLLALLLLSNQRLSQPRQQTVQPEQEDQKIKLSYRGVNYEPAPPAVEVSEGEVTGKYRGQVWRTSQLKNAVVVQPAIGMKYRGASVAGQQLLQPPVEETAVLND